MSQTEFELEAKEVDEVVEVILRGRGVSPVASSHRFVLNASALGVDTSRIDTSPASSSRSFSLTIFDLDLEVRERLTPNSLGVTLLDFDTRDPLLLRMLPAFSLESEHKSIVSGSMFENMSSAGRAQSIEHCPLLFSVSKSLITGDLVAGVRDFLRRAVFGRADVLSDALSVSLASVSSP